MVHVIEDRDGTRDAGRPLRSVFATGFRVGRPLP